MRPIHFPARPFEYQLSATPLSHAAEAGDVAHDLGYIGRRHQPPRVRGVGPAHVCYVWPMPTQLPSRPTGRC